MKAKEKSKYAHSTNSFKKTVGTFNKTRHGKAVAEKLSKESTPKIKMELVNSDKFDKVQMELFNDIVELLTRSGTLQNVGLRFVEMFCIQYKIYLNAKNNVESQGEVITVPMKYGDTTKKNPALDVMNNAFTQMITIADKFGFTPLAQSKIKVEITREETSEDQKSLSSRF